MALEGKLTDMPLLDLLRIFQRGARSGKLVLWNETEWALVWLREGQVVSAVLLTKPDRRPLRAGEQVIFHLFTWADGAFRYSPDPASGSYPITIKRPTSTLIVEELQRRRYGSVARAQPDLTMQTPLRLLPQMAGANERVALGVEEWFVLTHIGSQTTAWQAAAQTGLPPERVLMIMSHLIDVGLIMRAPLADLPQRRLTVNAPGPAAGLAQVNPPITRLTRAIKRRLQQIMQGA